MEIENLIQDFFDLAQREISLVIDKESESDNLIIFFGGINGGLGVPLFEFGTIANTLNAKKIFIRDRHQAFYHRGLENVEGISDIDSLKEYLKKLIRDSGAKKVSFFGNSAGGYASILFGILLGVDEVFAFSAQTLLAKEYLEKEIWEKVSRDNWNYIFSSKYSDLEKIIKAEGNSKTKIHIFYASDCVDSFHAERLKDFEGVILHKYDKGGHSLIRSLKRNGELISILNMIGE